MKKKLFDLKIRYLFIFSTIFFTMIFFHSCAKDRRYISSNNIIDTSINSLMIIEKNNLQPQTSIILKSNHLFKLSLQVNQKDGSHYVANQNVEWHLSNPDAANISNDGILKAAFVPSPREFQLSAHYNGFTKILKVKVIPKYLYIAQYKTGDENAEDGNIISCPYTNSPDSKIQEIFFHSCKQQIPLLDNNQPLKHPFKIKVLPQGNKAFLIGSDTIEPNASLHLYSCPLNIDGSIGTCTLAIKPNVYFDNFFEINSPYEFVFNSSSNRAYIFNRNLSSSFNTPSSLFVCSLNPEFSEIDSCSFNPLTQIAGENLIRQLLVNNSDIYAIGRTALNSSQDRMIHFDLNSTQSHNMASTLPISLQLPKEAQGKSFLGSIFFPEFSKIYLYTKEEGFSNRLLTCSLNQNKEIKNCNSYGRAEGPSAFILDSDNPRMLLDKKGMQVLGITQKSKLFTCQLNPTNGELIEETCSVHSLFDNTFPLVVKKMSEISDLSASED